MHIIDQYAYNNEIRAFNPAHKAGLASIVLLLCLLFNEPLVGLVAVGWMYLLVVRLAGLSWRTFGRVLLVEGTFMVLATMGVVISVSLADPSGPSRWTLHVGPLWLSSSPDSLYQGLSLVSRALGAASAMNFLALTTPLVDLVDLFRRWRVPAILIDITTIIYRFIFVLLESLERMRRAQESRLGYHTTYLRTMNNAALLGSRLFVDAFQRSQRLQIALESRGYDGGDLRVLSNRYESDHRIVWAGGLVIASMVGVWVLV